jgi:hypothetical protein
MKAGTVHSGMGLFNPKVGKQRPVRHAGIAKEPLDPIEESG